MKKRLTSLLLAATLMLVYVTPIYASASNYDNVESIKDMNVRQCNKFISDVIYDIVNKDEAGISSKVSKFSSSCYEKLLPYVNSNKIGSNVLSDIVIDFAYPENSSTDDIVIMANTKIWFNDSDYNKAYMFEFHVNSDGDIYGYNVWQY